MTSRHRSICILVLFASALAPRAESMDAKSSRTPAEQEYWAQIERRDWTEAVLAAEKLIEAARLRSNEEPLALAEALTLLGNAQLGSRNYLAAESAYSEALQILQPRVAPASDKLLEPLRGMGYTLAFAEKHELAVPFMERALLVSRRTHGLFNMNQQGILRQLATSLAKSGRHVEAETQMQYLLRVGEQTYGAKDPRMAGVYELLGDFYLQGALVGAARQSYRTGLQIVEKKLGRGDVATVPPLRAFAESYRRELLFSLYGIRGPSERGAGMPDPTQADGKAMNPRFLSAEGERALKRALKTLDASPSRSTAMLFDTLLDMGDWHMVKGEIEEAMPHYRRAASLLDQIEPEHSASARAKLSFPAQLYYPIPTAATRNLYRSSEEVTQTFVHLTFTVAADGTVVDEHVIDENSSPRHVAETLDAIQSTRYRPKFVNGEPVETRDVSLRQVFKLRRERETE